MGGAITKSHHGSSSHRGGGLEVVVLQEDSVKQKFRELSRKFQSKRNLLDSPGGELVGGGGSSKKHFGFSMRILSSRIVGDTSKSTTNRFSQKSKFGFPLLIDKTQDGGGETAEDDEKNIREQFQESLISEGSILGDAILTKDKIIELVKWILRKSRDFKRNAEIINLFTNCLSGGLNFEEFCMMYEGIATRVELESCFDIKFSELDINHSGELNKRQIIEMVNHILTEFAQIWCSKQEIVEMRVRMGKLFQDDKIHLSQLELYEIFDSMLVTIRLIHMAKKKCLEFDTDKNGYLDEDELMDLAEWILKAYEHQGVQIKEEDKTALKDLIIENYDLNHSGVLGVREISLLFESVMEKKRWFHNLNTMAASKYSMAQNSQYSMSKGIYSTKRNRTHERRLSAQSVRNEAQLAAIGINTHVHDKFTELDTAKKSGLYQMEVLQLLEWMYRRRKSQLSAYKAEFEKEWEQEVVTYEEFCSMYEDATMRIELLITFDKTFEALCTKKGRQVIFDLTKLRDLVDIVLPNAFQLGCTELERTTTIQNILKEHKYLSTIRIGFGTKEELQDVYEDICITSRLYKNAALKFNELDKNNSSTLEGDELNDMAVYILTLTYLNKPNIKLDNNHDPLVGVVYTPTELDITFLRDQILRRFGKDFEHGVLTLGEFACIHDETLRKKKLDRSVSRYKLQVKQLLVDLLATSTSATESTSNNITATSTTLRVATPQVTAAVTDEKEEKEGEQKEGISHTLSVAASASIQTQDNNATTTTDVL